MSKARSLADLLGGGAAGVAAFSGNGAIDVPAGTTAERPGNPNSGYVRFNTTEASLEQYDGTSWIIMPKPPIVSTLTYPNSQTAVGLDGGEVVTISGVNFETGVNVKFGTTYATSVTRTNSTSLSVTVPALTAGDYDVIVEQTDGTQAILTDGLSVNAAPVFTTAAGSLGSLQNDVAMSTITVVATEDDSGTITYAVTTGALPTGTSLSGADITGTPTGYSSETTANFTITATDDEGQTTSRNFSLTVTVQFYSYTIDQSLRFNDDDSAYLSRTPSSAGNRKTWTWSGWVKRGNIDTNQQIFHAQSSGVSHTVQFNSTNQLDFYSYNGSGYDFQKKTTQIFRDVSAWYHIVLIFDSTDSTAADRAKVYINGGRVTDFASSSDASLNFDGQISNSTAHNLGRHTDGNNYTDGYLAEVNFIDGQALDASYFGQAKEGVWIPKAYSGSYGTNGFYLDFSNSSSIGADSSGNGNNFTASNLAATDVVLDSPTNNFCTMNPVDTTSLEVPESFSQGNLRVDTPASGNGFATGTMGMSSGKWYWEVRMESHDGISIAKVGITGDCTPSEGELGGASCDYAYSSYEGNKQNVGGSSYGSSWTYNDIIGHAYDADNGTLTFYKNGVSQGTAFTGITGTMRPAMSDGSGATYGVVLAYNFGQDSSFYGSVTRQNNTDDNDIGDFYYTPPTGYLALCNANLPENDTFELNYGEKPSDHFDIVTWTGNGSTQTITMPNMTSDIGLLWWKARSTAQPHLLIDTVRGDDYYLISSTSGAEGSATHFGSISGNTFSLDDGDPNQNQSGQTYVGWAWKANGTAVSNTDGSITSSVSANTTAGFSIISYAGNSTAGATIGHGLNSAPEMIVVKNRNSTDQWQVYHTLLGTTQFIQFNTSAALDQSTYPMFNSTSPTDSVFTVGNISHTNNSGNNYIAYAWHSVPGFSKVGSYVGNGSVDGPFVYTGFKPAFVMLKRTDSGNYWMILDNARESYNPFKKGLYPSSADVESNFGNSTGIDFLSNGFKHKDNVNSTNAAAGEYIYIAFAEDPFKYGNAL